MNVLRQYILTLTELMGWKTGLALGLMILVGMSEGVSLVMIVPLLQLVGLEVQQGRIGQFAGFFSALFSAAGIRPTLISVLCIYVLVVIIQSLFRRWENYVSFTLQYEFVVRLRERLYKAIANTQWLFFCRNRSSDFTHVLTLEMERVGGATYYVLSLIATGILSLVYLSFALWLSARATGLVFICGAGMMFLLRKKTNIAHDTGEGLSEAMNGLYDAISEHLGGMKLAKSYSAEERHIKNFGRLAQQVHGLYARSVRNQAEVNYWFSIGSVIILSIILYVSFEVLSLSTASVLLLLFLFARVMPRLSSIQQDFQSFLNMLPSFTRIADTEKRCENAVEPKAIIGERIELRDQIRFNQVSFSYDGNMQAIRNLDLIAKAGQTTAVVGPSGAGKSTVADLMMGLIAPEEGQILIDEKELCRERMKCWRELIGYVPQDPFLFHDTVRANLLWAKPEASDGDIREALRLAAAEEFAFSLPKGLETVLGDRGVLISGGERQRLALARVLLRKPALLILDEATSSLDSENEKRIQSAIEKLHGQMTILIISHRLSTIRDADKIYVIENGSLIESGTWNSLIIRTDGRFRALCQAQGIE